MNELNDFLGTNPNVVFEEKDKLIRYVDTCITYLNIIKAFNISARRNVAEILNDNYVFLQRTHIYVHDLIDVLDIDEPCHVNYCWKSNHENVISNESEIKIVYNKSSLFIDENICGLVVNEHFIPSEVDSCFKFEELINNMGDIREIEINTYHSEQIESFPWIYNAKNASIVIHHN